MSCRVRSSRKAAQALNPARSDIGSCSILWDVEKEFNVGGGKGRRMIGNVPIATVMKLRASGDSGPCFMVAKGTAMQSDVGIPLPAVAEIAPVFGQPALSI